MKLKFLLFLVFLITFTIKAKANFDFNNRCVEAYKAALDMRINDAAALLRDEKQQNPQNGIAILLDNYVDYYGLLASESKADYEKLKDKRSDRLSALEDNDQNSPYCRFAQAEVYLQWSLLKAKFGDYFSSAMDAKKANNLSKENAEKFPDFLPSQISLAIVNITFGSIPANFRSITHFLGMNGNVQAGIRQLEQLRLQLPKTKYAFFNDEVISSMCSLDLVALHDDDGYKKLISYLSGMSANSLLKVYLQAYIAARTAHNDEVIAFIEAAPKSGKYVRLPALNYLLGSAKLNRMDSDTPMALYNYIKDFRGTNYIKDAYLKMAYYYLLQRDEDKYQYFIKQVKTRGYALDEKDKQALKEANDARPDIDLLKARLYFDGGYYNKALAQLTGKDVNTLSLVRDKTEYYYRLGRIYEKTNKPNDAASNYQRAIDFGKTTSYYYAANAAVFTGRIFEEKKDFKRAADYYNLALGMKDHEYKTSIDNDAKDGLKRIGQ